MLCGSDLRHNPGRRSLDVWGVGSIHRVGGVFPRDRMRCLTLSALIGWSRRSEKCARQSPDEPQAPKLR